MGVVVCTSRTKLISQGRLLFTQLAVASTFHTSQSDICTKWETAGKSLCPTLEILLPGATSLHWLSQAVAIVSKSSNKSLRCRPETNTTNGTGYLGKVHFCYIPSLFSSRSSSSSCSSCSSFSAKDHPTDTSKQLVCFLFILYF